MTEPLSSDQYPDDDVNAVDPDTDPTIDRVLSRRASALADPTHDADGFVDGGYDGDQLDREPAHPRLVEPVGGGQETAPGGTGGVRGQVDLGARRAFGAGFPRLPGGVRRCDALRGQRDHAPELVHLVVPVAAVAARGAVGRTQPVPLVPRAQRGGRDAEHRGDRAGCPAHRLRLTSWRVRRA